MQLHVKQNGGNYWSAGCYNLIATLLKHSHSIILLFAVCAQGASCAGKIDNDLLGKWRLKITWKFFCIDADAGGVRDHLASQGLSNSELPRACKKPNKECGVGLRTFSRSSVISILFLLKMWLKLI